jgi:hypothetical protein
MVLDMQPELKGQWLILLTEWDSVLCDSKGEGRLLQIPSICASHHWIEMGSMSGRGYLAAMKHEPVYLGV